MLGLEAMRRYDPDNKKPCGCGCGILIVCPDKWGNINKFARYHGNRGRKFIHPEIQSRVCANCGGKTKLNKRGDPIWNVSRGIPWCKKCDDKENYWKNPEKHNREVKASTLKHHDAAVARYRRYHETHKAEDRARRIIRYQKNKVVEIQKRIMARRLNGSTSKRRRLDLLAFLGGKCIRCGYNHNVRALCLDHINGGGSKDRKSFGSLLKFYRYYLNNPELAKERLQVLCFNCNAIKMDERNEYWMGGRFVTITQ